MPVRHYAITVVTKPSVAVAVMFAPPVEVQQVAVKGFKELIFATLDRQGGTKLSG